MSICWSMWRTATKSAPGCRALQESLPGAGIQGDDGATKTQPTAGHGTVMLALADRRSRIRSGEPGSESGRSARAGQSSAGTVLDRKPGDREPRVRPADAAGDGLTATNRD